MASRLKVAIVGATGETGQSIVEALLASPEQFVSWLTSENNLGVLMEAPTS